jgi:hypothetical protein
MFHSFIFGFSESLRKHPPVARTDRICTQQYTIPGTNINLEKGCVVAISVMGLHHDPQYFPQPEVFDPDRFLPEQTLTRSPYVFLPFGAGPRNCIGKMDRYVLVYLWFIKTVDITGRTCMCTCTIISESILNKINVHCTTSIRDSEMRLSYAFFWVISWRL